MAAWSICGAPSTPRVSPRCAGPNQGGQIDGTAYQSFGSSLPLLLYILGITTRRVPARETLCPAATPAAISAHSALGSALKNLRFRRPIAVIGCAHADSKPTVRGSGSGLGGGQGSGQGAGEGLGRRGLPGYTSAILPSSAILPCHDDYIILSIRLLAGSRVSAYSCSRHSLCRSASSCHHSGSQSS